MIQSREMAGMLGVQPVTLRKYSKALEGAGYVFTRSAAKNRQYDQKDAIALQQLVTICKSSGMSVDMAAKAVMAGVQRESEVAMTTEIIEEERYVERYGQAAEMIEQLLAQNRDLAEQNRELIELARESNREMGQLRGRMSAQDDQLKAIMGELMLFKEVWQHQNRPWWKFWAKKIDFLEHEQQQDEGRFLLLKERSKSIYNPPGRNIK